jgi:hypothetical protein
MRAAVMPAEELEAAILMEAGASVAGVEASNKKAKLG